MIQTFRKYRLIIIVVPFLTSSCMKAMKVEMKYLDSLPIAEFYLYYTKEMPCVSSIVVSDVEFEGPAVTLYANKNCVRTNSVEICKKHFGFNIRGGCEFLIKGRKYKTDVFAEQARGTSADWDVR
jgi:hypothetical protein